MRLDGWSAVGALESARGDDGTFAAGRAKPNPALALALLRTCRPGARHAR
jgi:hypothetical protein